MDGRSAKQLVRHRLVFCTSEDPVYLGQNLTSKNEGAAARDVGWISAPLGSGSAHVNQELVFEFETVFNLQEIVILSHEHFIASKIVVAVTAASKDDLNRCEWQVLGFARLEDNTERDYQAREKRCLSISPPGDVGGGGDGVVVLVVQIVDQQSRLFFLYRPLLLPPLPPSLHIYMCSRVDIETPNITSMVRLTLLGCHVNKFNAHNQVGVCSVFFSGNSCREVARTKVISQGVSSGESLRRQKTKTILRYLVRADPRVNICRFFDLVAQCPEDALTDKPGSAQKKRRASLCFDKASVFTVWRPTRCKLSPLADFYVLRQPLCVSSSLLLVLSLSLPPPLPPTIQHPFPHVIYLF
jgi:hypothetical protein